MFQFFHFFRIVFFFVSYLSLSLSLSAILLLKRNICIKVGGAGQGREWAEQHNNRRQRIENIQLIMVEKFTKNRLVKRSSITRRIGPLSSRGGAKGGQEAELINVIIIMSYKNHSTQLHLPSFLLFLYLFFCVFSSISGSTSGQYPDFRFLSLSFSLSLHFRFPDFQSIPQVLGGPGID